MSSEIKREDVDNAIDEIIDALEKHFGDKISSGFTCDPNADYPRVSFSIEFRIYNYYNVMLSYGSGRLGSYVRCGDCGNDLICEPYYNIDMDGFLCRVDRSEEHT